MQMTVPERLRQFTTPTPIFDHGYIMLVDVMGDDDAIIQAARVSYANGTQKTSSDRGLLRYLMRSRHTSPFEQARIKLEVKLPIFVERQWVRHRTASLNEMSARYSVLPEEFYQPDPSDVRAQSTSNKQGREGALENSVITEYLADLQQTCTNAYADYQKALNAGVTRELARCLLPVNVYTSKVWTMDLHNLLHFLSLRLDPHAQWEIRQYAEAIAEIVKVWVPWAWEAFEDYRLEAMYLTKYEVQALKLILSRLTGEGYKPELLIQTAADVVVLSGREKNEMVAKLTRLLEG
jgi:thymidylate synthase (FAD)